ncbi:hypothetical protein [Pseudooctadecabacter sp.]|uniref:hypothetical protein n=1 Tax=Pseudooctadecabacter sp. TaxID=1966338 RepID=UPI0025DAD51E|nr:hypothetical protein [Pseudooctadecabacter sp.]
MRVFAVLMACAGPALADVPLTGDAFEALVEGKTLSFSVGDVPYGTEYYAPGRRVIWSFIDGTCQSGEWYETAGDSGPQICFTYETSADPQCWQVFEVGGRLRADFMNAPGTTVLYEATEAEPLVCGGVGT